ncbi:MAG: transposase [Verrucomicrobiota bacterium]
MSTPPSNENRSVYRNQSERLRAIFDSAKSLTKVLCVALDFAKRKHVALICDGNGDILKNSFTVHNSREGADYLCEQISATARRRRIPKKHIFLGGEDEASYIENFSSAIAERGYLVVRVNAAEAKKNRENYLASTDDLDLFGIAKTMLNRRAAVAREPGKSDPDIYKEIRDLTRGRRKLVRDQTATSNRVHAHVDRLFPGFLDSKKSGLTAFGPASLHLMKENFSAPQIARRKPDSLARTLHKQRVHHPDEVAAKLIELARSALSPDPNRINAQQRTLSSCVDLYETYESTSLGMRNEAAALLASTPYAFLTSLPGISFVLAAGIAGELGAPSQLHRLDSLCAYSGIVPATYQSGGPDSPAVTTGTSQRCNHILKDWVAQSSQKLRQYGPPEWRTRFARWEAAGQHGLFAGGRRYLRLMRTLVINQIPYETPEARQRTATREERALSAEATWEVLVRKWRLIPNWKEVAFAEDKPLGFWRRLAIELHGPDLPLPKER